MNIFGFVASLFFFQVAYAALSTGPCPSYPGMKDFDLAKGNFPWVGFGTLETTSAEALGYKCVKNSFDKAPNKLVAGKFNGINVKDSMAEQREATLTPNAQQPGIFEVKLKENYKALGELAKATAVKYQVLDTDYTNYLVSVVCFTDGSTWHHGIAMADFKVANPPADQLEKARTTITNAGFSADTIKTIDQSNC